MQEIEHQRATCISHCTKYSQLRGGSGGWLEFAARMLEWVNSIGGGGGGGGALGLSSVAWCGRTAS